MKTRNRVVVWLCLALSALMVLSVLPVGAISVSVENVTPSGGAADVPSSAEDLQINTGNPAMADTIAVGAVAEDYQPAEGATAISTAAEFAAMSKTGSYYLTADITVNATFQDFAGTFDGNGHTIYTTVPVFSAPQRATIKNLTTDNVTVEGAKQTITVSTMDNFGVVAVGTAFDCNFFNICNKASADTSAAPTSNDVKGRAAGIVGRTSGYTILERCRNEGNLTGAGMTAGIVSLISSEDSSEAVVINCTNTGTLTTPSHGAIGGIVTSVEAPTATTLIYGCRNEGTITAAGNAGGMVGYTFKKNNAALRIEQCTNTGAISSSSSTGKAAGMIADNYIPLTVNNCTNSGTITSSQEVAAGMVANCGATAGTLTVKGCINAETGTIIAGATSTNNQMSGAGIVARCYTTVLISNCENNASITGAGQSGGIGGWLNTLEITVKDCANTGDVTARLSYAGGIAARMDASNNQKGLSVHVSGCINSGDVSSYHTGMGGIVTYGEGSITIVSCTNSGDMLPREDAPLSRSLDAAGIVANYAKAGITVIDCTNSGNIQAKAGITKGNVTVPDLDELGNQKTDETTGELLTVTKNDVVIKAAGGKAAGICASVTSDNYKGASFFIGCTNTGNVTAGDPTTEGELYFTPNVDGAHGYSETCAAGILGYFWNGSDACYPVVQYCVSTGSITGGLLASYAIGYSNLIKGVIMDNVFSGELSTLAFPEGTTSAFASADAHEASALNALVWSNAAVVPQWSYARNYFGSFLSDNPDIPLLTNNAANTNVNAVLTSTLNNDFFFTDGDEETAIEAARANRNVATTITTAEEFLAMVPYGNYVLGADITLESEYGKPDSTVEPEIPEQAFFGSFDGNGHTITLSGTAAFFRLAAGATVKNLTLEGSVERNDTVGALANFGGGTIIGVTNKASVKSTGNNAGGLIGSQASKSVWMKDCVNEGAVTTTVNNAGGMIGYGANSDLFLILENCTNRGTITRSNTTFSSAVGAAGMIGEVGGNFVRLINCTNEGTIVSTSNAGGIVAKSQNNKNTEYIGCVNTGNVTSSATVDDAYGAGGIQGYNGTAYCVFTDCYNSGTIQGYVAGGISGDCRKGGSFTGCVNTGTVITTSQSAAGIANHRNDQGATVFSFTDCVNTGNIKGSTATTGRNGGIVGECRSIAAGTPIVFTSCVNAGTVEGGQGCGGIAGSMWPDKSGNTDTQNGKALIVRFISCVNVGTVQSTSGDQVGGMAGYIWGSSLNNSNQACGVLIQNCISAGTVTTTGTLASALCGYMNTNYVSITGNVIAGTLSASQATFLYYSVGTASLADKSMIKDNFVESSSLATYAVYKTSETSSTPAADYSVSAKSTGTTYVAEIAVPTADKGYLFNIAGITASKANGSLGAGLDKLLNRSGNSLAVYGTDETKLGEFTSLADAARFAAQHAGSEIRLLADYYMYQQEHILTDGSYTINGNGKSLYTGGTYGLSLVGDGIVEVKDLTIYAAEYGIYVGINRRDGKQQLTLTNVSSFATAANATGYARLNVQGSAIRFNEVAGASLTVDNTEANQLRNALRNCIDVNNGTVTLDGGKYVSYAGWIVGTNGTGGVANIVSGSFIGTTKRDAAINVDNGKINITGGYFENNGFCVARSLGGVTKTQYESNNSITTETNATLNISGGVFVLTNGNNQDYGAVIRTGGGSTYGRVYISGGTFVNQQTSGSKQVIYRNNSCSTLSITGGRFLGTTTQEFFIKSEAIGNGKNGYVPSTSHTSRALTEYSGTCTYGTKEYKVWTMFGATDGELAMSTEKGAEVRMTAGSTGLRFTSTLSAEMVAKATALAGETGSVSYGTVIAPMDFVLHAEAFTMAALDAATTLAGHDTRYLNIAATSLGTTVDEDGNVEIRAALTNIKETNYTRAFAAIAYVKVTTAEGETSYYYGAFDGTDNVRAIRQVAAAALADTSETETAEYKYAVTTDEGTVYSRYSDYAREVMQSFMPSSTSGT